jgi:hypothetical protein
MCIKNNMKTDNIWKGTLFENTENIQKPFELSRDRVWYGFSKLTKKVMRKRELAIIYENCGNGDDRLVTQKIHIAYTRRQTVLEAEDGKNSNRSYTKYSYFIDDKKFKGDINAVLLENYNADSKNVSEKERKEIMKCLLDKYTELKRLNNYEN